MSRYIRIRGKENIDKCLEKGKGVILVSLHLGNWELGGTVVAGMKYPVNAIALEHSHKKINEFFTRQRGINGTRSIPLGMGIKESFRALARNEVLAIMGDKDYTSGGINIDFFGRPARMPKGPAAFSLKTGAPILVTVMVREKDDTFTLHIDPPIEKSASPGSEIRVQDLMGEYIKVFERYIREHPGQWYVFRRIWKPQ